MASSAPAAPSLARSYDAVLVAGSSLAIALCAQIAISLPFTPVPVTLQTFAVLVTGFLLGSRRGVTAVLLYLAEGCAGLPVFSGGGAGIAHLLGPTGGYLLGFLLAAPIVGRCAESGAGRTWQGTVLTLIAGNLALYAPGLARLGAFVGMERAFSLGLVPFIAGDFLKIAAGAATLLGVSRAGARARRGRA